MTDASREGAPARSGRRRHRRAVRRGTEQPTENHPAPDDDDRVWGDRTGRSDEEILREVPPHWR